MTSYTIWRVLARHPIDHAFNEISFALKLSFRELGMDVPIVYDPSQIQGRGIVIAPHLITKLGYTQIPANLILYNLEQVQPDNTDWVTPAYLDLMKRLPVWDYSRQNIKMLNDMGVNNVTYCGVGYSPILEQIKPKEKDIDVLFYGSKNDRRNKILDALAERGLNVAGKYNVWNEERDDLIARSKIILNHHYFEAKIFEILRVSYLLANKCFVVSESGNDKEQLDRFKNGVVFAHYDDLVEACVKYINSPDQRQTIANKGYEIMKQKSQTAFLKEALTA